MAFISGQFVVATSGQATQSITAAAAAALLAAVDFSFSVAQTMYGINSSQQAFTLSGKDNITGASAGAGGTVTISGGDSYVSSSGAGGLAKVVGGAALGTNSDGGGVQLIAADGRGTGGGGNNQVYAGSSGTGATGNGGYIEILAGSALSTSGDGGDIDIHAGAASGGGTQGAVNIGTATNLIGLFGVSAVAQPASVNQAALSLTGSYTGGDTVDLSTLEADIASIQTLVNELRAAGVALGTIKGAA